MRIPTGQSGSPLSPPYRGSHVPLGGDESVPMVCRPEVYEDGAIRRLKLEAGED
jgi:hypothetical protein